eukprot:2303263-Rhodomonas_salina.4
MSGPDVIGHQVSELSCYDVAPITPGVAADLSHCNTNSKVTSAARLRCPCMSNPCDVLHRDTAHIATRCLALRSRVGLPVHWLQRRRPQEVARRLRCELLPSWRSLCVLSFSSTFCDLKKFL